MEEFFEVAESLGLSSDQVGLEKSPVVSKVSLLQSSSSQTLLTDDFVLASASAAPLGKESTSSLLDSPARRSAPAEGVVDQPLGDVDHDQPLGGDVDHDQPLRDVDQDQPLGGDVDHDQQASEPVSVAPEQSLRVFASVRICHICLKRCNEKNFKRHIKTHEKHTLTTCDQCGANVGRRDHMKRHREERCPR